MALHNIAWGISPACLHLIISNIGISAIILIETLTSYHNKIDSYIPSQTKKHKDSEPLGNKNGNRCRACLWFDPVYDECPFYGRVKADDTACENFQPAE